MGSDHDDNHGPATASGTAEDVPKALPPDQKENEEGKKNTIPLATREEMSAARLPLAYRDNCAHLLIPLNDCRRATFYLPWKCTVSFSPAP